MACPISHIVYAKKYFDHLETVGLNDLDNPENLIKSKEKINKDEFILGCTFPDIRRIDKNIKRKDTHLQFEPLDLNFSGLNSFEAGWKFHLYCDMRREEILNKYNFYSLENTAEFYNLPAKFAEDILVYDEYNNWEKIIYYFNNAPYLNEKINISSETYHLWYAIIAKYIEKKPDNKTIKIFLSKQNISMDLEKFIYVFDELGKNDKVIEILKKVENEII